MLKFTPIFKSGDAADMNNYRPISILTILSKLLESHVHDAFYSYLCSYDLISANQSGFRKHHSCETGLASILSDWQRSIDTGLLIGCVNIDLRKAFDLINYEILHKKLKCYGCKDSAISWFRSYLSNRKQTVCVEGQYSKMLKVNHGIPQGSILGPLLFIIFINDDTSLFTMGSNVDNISNQLNNDLTHVSDWFKLNRLVINEGKTNCMLICNTQKRIKLPKKELNVMLNGSNLINVDKQMLLGVTIDNNLRIEAHVDNICKKLSRHIYLFSQIRNCLTFNLLNMCSLFIYMCCFYWFLKTFKAII